MADETTATLPDDADVATLPEEVPDDLLSLGDPTKLDQAVEITDAGPCKKHVKITVARQAIDDRMDEKYRELINDQSAALPGFRPGKAPRKIVERRFKSAVKEEVRREVLMASLQQLAEDSNIAPLAPPDLKADQLEIPDEGPFIYEFVVEVRPEFDLPEYKGMKIRKPTRKFTDVDVANEQRKLLERHGKVVDKTDGIVAMNNVLEGTLSFLDGDKELNKSEKVRVRVEKKLALNDGVAEDFGRVIVGAKVGDAREFDFKLAETVADQALKGKTVRGKFEVKNVLSVEVPELTPALLEEFGVTNESNLHELISSSLERNLEFQQRQFARQQILSQVMQSTKWDLPRDLLVNQATRTLQRRVMEMRSAGMSDEQIDSRMAVLRQNVLQSTAGSLMEHFVLQKIAEVEKIEIEDSDVDSEIARIAANRNESFRKVKAQFEREELIESLATELLERKALDIVLNNAVYEEFEIKPEDEEGETATVSAQAVAGDLVVPTAPTEAADTTPTE